MYEDYRPRPIDTSDVSLPEDLIPLFEMMAQNTHEVWARGRMNEGWKWGPVRNDEKKENPCLVAYDELPESEKEYDRNTSLETLKLIIKLGYTIEKAE